MADKNYHREMTQEEIEYRLSEISKIPDIELTDDIAKTPELVYLYNEFNYLKAEGKPESLERLKFLANKFTYVNYFTKQVNNVDDNNRELDNVIEELGLSEEYEEAQAPVR